MDLERDEAALSRAHDTVMGIVSNFTFLFSKSFNRIFTLNVLCRLAYEPTTNGRRTHDGSRPHNDDAPPPPSIVGSSKHGTTGTDVTSKLASI